MSSFSLYAHSKELHCQNLWSCKLAAAVILSVWFQTIVIVHQKSFSDFFSVFIFFFSCIDIPIDLEEATEEESSHDEPSTSTASSSSGK